NPENQKNQKNKLIFGESPTGEEKVYPTLGGNSMDLALDQRKTIGFPLTLPAFAGAEKVYFLIPFLLSISLLLYTSRFAGVSVMSAEPSNLTPLIVRAVCSFVPVAAFPVGLCLHAVLNPAKLNFPAPSNPPPPKVPLSRGKIFL
ncbi:hypothetical protein KCA24_35105, partial [Escherichia coli]|nr:hypothetical protein [Escherichia coli]